MSIYCRNVRNAELTDRTRRRGRPYGLECHAAVEAMMMWACVQTFRFSDWLSMSVGERVPSDGAMLASNQPVTGSVLAGNAAKIASASDSTRSRRRSTQRTPRQRQCRAFIQGQQPSISMCDHAALELQPQRWLLLRVLPSHPASQPASARLPPTHGPPWRWWSDYTATERPEELVAVPGSSARDRLPAPGRCGRPLLAVAIDFLGVASILCAAAGCCCCCRR